VFEDVVVCVAAELVTPSPSFAFATAIALPGMARAVILVAVELDGQSVVGPVAVNAPPSNGVVRVRQDQTVPS
jgi:hypothetical protein